MMRIARSPSSRIVMTRTGSQRARLAVNHWAAHTATGRAIASSKTEGTIAHSFKDCPERRIPLTPLTWSRARLEGNPGLDRRSAHADQVRGRQQPADLRGPRYTQPARQRGDPGAVARSKARKLEAS